VEDVSVSVGVSVLICTVGVSVLVCTVGVSVLTNICLSFPGHRHVVTKESVWLKDMANILSQEFNSQGGKAFNLPP